MGDVRRPVREAGAGTASVEVKAKRLVRRPMTEERKEQLRLAYEKAAADPAYQAEMAEIDRAFDVTVGDGLAD